jgi:two-component system, OmpR family, phosphate regulon sensor histidine kinase PhoR
MNASTPTRLIIALALLALGAVAVYNAGGTAPIILMGLIASIFAVGIAVLPGADDGQKQVLKSRPEDKTWQSLIDAIRDPIVLISEGRVLAANSGAKTLLGDHICGEDVRLALRHPAALERIADPSDVVVTTIVGLGGRDTHWEMHLATLSSGGRLVHLIDRSFRYAAERARVDFVANASHELRTPLAAILGFVETLQDASAGADPVIRARFLSVIAAEAARMQTLTEDLMSLSRIEADKHEAPATLLALDQVVEQALDEIRDTSGKRPSRIETHFAPILPQILGERSQIMQLVHNLVTNALKYAGADSVVQVKIALENDNVVLSVVDQGDGIASEHIPRLTERFYRVDQARSRAEGGTGLGLAIVKHIVERHRGHLNIKSVLGEGTTIMVEFPRVKVAVT